VVDCLFEGEIVIGVRVYGETVCGMIICKLRGYVCFTLFLTCF
jgi:hypothetical protein